MTSSDVFAPVIGFAEDLEPGLRRIVAPNPSPMTYTGTNTYLLGTRDIAVIDPGPLSDAHLDAILAAVSPKQQITHIFVTHSHLDHAPLARPLAEKTGAPVFAFGTATAGRSAIMRELAASGLSGGGEGIDWQFEPDETVHDGQSICGSDWCLKVLHTPGHLGNHICLQWHDACFTADHVMGWASSLVSPPDGDLTDFMASCARLRASDWRVFHPGHGASIAAPSERLDWLMLHRRARETAILQVLKTGPATAADITARVYLDTPQPLLPAAERNVLAHLIDLKQKNHVLPLGALQADTRFRLLSHGSE